MAYPFLATKSLCAFIGIWNWWNHWAPASPVLLALMVRIASGLQIISYGSLSLLVHKPAPSRHQAGTKLALSDMDNFEKLIVYCTETRSVVDMLEFMGLRDRTKFRNKYVKPLLEEGITEMTIPDKPNSQNQKYRLTSKGIEWKEMLKKQNATPSC